MSETDFPVRFPNENDHLDLTYQDRLGTAIIGSIEQSAFCAGARCLALALAPIATRDEQQEGKQQERDEQGQGSGGAERRFAAVAAMRCPSLRRLSLATNPLDSAGIVHLTRAIQRGAKLRRLVLGASCKLSTLFLTRYKSHERQSNFAETATRKSSSKGEYVNFWCGTGGNRVSTRAARELQTGIYTENKIRKELCHFCGATSILPR